MIHLLPIGGGRDTAPLAYFAAQAAACDTDGVVELRVLPCTYASDPYEIAETERQERLRQAEERRAELERVFAASLPGRFGRVLLLPVLVRADAYAAELAALVGPEVDGIFCLGGDQTVAMRVLRSTPLEAALEAAVRRGAVFGGSSAGASIQSRAMLAAHPEGFGATEGLRAGSLEIWPAGGLPFGARGVIIDQHMYQRGRMGRLLHEVAVTGLVGIGIDRDTVAHLKDGVVARVFGPSGVAVVEPPLTWKYSGPTRSLSARGFTVHLLGPGSGPYDPRAVRRSLAGRGVGVSPGVGTSQGFGASPGFGCLHTPAGAGPLILAARAAHLFPDVPVLPLPHWGAAVAGTADRNRALARWRAGEPLLVPEPALAGSVYCSEPVSEDEEVSEGAAIRRFRIGGVPVAEGLGLLPGTAFEPDLLRQKRWGRLFGIVAAQPGVVAVGLEHETALVVGPDGARVAGNGAVVVVDGRFAAFGQAENGVLTARDLLVDTYVEGDIIGSTP